MRITADSRYELYVNGTFVGHGPVRAWPSPWPVDEYDVRHLLRAGRNVVGVLVTHFGISTFQYLHDEAGRDRVDRGRWRARSSPMRSGSRRRTKATCGPCRGSRVSRRGRSSSTRASRRDCRRSGQRRRLTIRNGSGARAARRGSAAARKVRRPRHPDAHARSRSSRRRFSSIETVRPADYTFALNPREFVNAADRSANHINCRMLLATFIHSDAEQKIDLHQPHTRPFLPWKLNGAQLKFDDQVAAQDGHGRRARDAAGGVESR